MSHAAAAFMLVAALFFPSAMSAAPNDRIVLNLSTVTDAACTEGSTVVGVTQPVANEVDVATDGTGWAVVNFECHITVVQTGPGLFCATIADRGTFTTMAGPGLARQAAPPRGGRRLGDLRRGYVTGVFTAALKPTPDASTNGRLPVFGAQCGPTVAGCAPIPEWVESYFDEVGGVELDWWIWR